MTSKLLFVLILAMGFLVAASGHGTSDFDLYFTTGSVQDYVKHYRPLVVTTKFTICFWMRTWAQKRGTPFSYAKPNQFNEITITNPLNFRLYVGGAWRSATAASFAADGRWHHICATWNRNGGVWKFFKDGLAVAGGTGFKNGYTIATNGITVLGQDQDSFGDNFHTSDSYEGELAQLNVWNYDIHPLVIKYGLSRYCCDQNWRGKVKRWSDFWAGVHGDVRIISPTACKRCL